MAALYRLPALNIAPTSTAASLYSDDSAVTAPVLTATSRYRNDPYKINVLRHPSADVTSTKVVIPMAPSEPAPVQNRLSGKTLRPTRHLLPALPRAATDGVDTFVDSTPTQRVALIKYKRTFTSAFYNPREIQGLCAGNVIIVHGDRGEHIATVVNPNLTRPKSTPTTIIRLATGDDLLQHQRVREDESIALDACRAHATRLGLDNLMEIVDVEFQLDFQKLTVFFRPLEEGQFVDFRNLQRALYQHFRCRIWIVDN